MRRIASLFSLSIILSAAACDSDGGGKVAADTTGGGGDSTATTGDTTATTPDVTSPADTTATTPTDTSVTTTTTQDTSVTPDTVDEGDKLCVGILGCAVENCNGLPQAQAEACIQTCADDSAVSEQQAFAGSVQCQAACVEALELPDGQQPTPAQEKEVYECLLADCIEEEVACQAGTVFATDTCQQLNACLNGCGAGGTPRCRRDCFADSTEVAAETFVSLSFCVFSQCADKTGAAFNTCSQQAQGVPPCKTYVDSCIGDAGAAPGAGGGGSAGAGKFEFDERQFRAFFK